MMTKLLKKKKKEKKNRIILLSLIASVARELPDQN